MKENKETSETSSHSQERRLPTRTHRKPAAPTPRRLQSTTSPQWPIPPPPLQVTIPNVLLLRDGFDELIPCSDPSDTENPRDDHQLNSDYLAYTSLLGTDATQDPFAGQRDATNDPFKADNADATANGDDTAVRTNSESLSPPLSPDDRRMSREWGTIFFIFILNFFFFSRPSLKRHGVVLMWECHANPLFA